MFASRPFLGFLIAFVVALPQARADLSPGAGMATRARPTLQQRLQARQQGRGKKLLLLSFAGGGMKGALSLEMYARLDQSLKAKLGPKFELRDHVAAVAGTSTGALIASGIAAGLTIDQIRGAYHQGQEVFPAKRPSLWHKILSFGRAQYDNAGLKRMLQKTFGARKALGELQIPILIPSVEMNTPQDDQVERGGIHGAVYQTVAKAHSDADVQLTDALLASTAAPTLLPMAPNPKRRDAKGAFNADGAMFANDPSMELWAHVKQAAREAAVTIHGQQDLAMLTFGTGRLPGPKGKLNPRRGKLGWIAGERNIIDVFLNGQADSIHRQLKLGLDSSYKRLDEWLPRPDMRLDDAKIVRELEDYVGKNAALQQRIDKTADWVIEQLDLKPAK